MESSSSVLIAVGAFVPLAHFVYTIVRDLRQSRRDSPNVRVFATVRERRDGMGIVRPMKCVCVANVSGRTVSVVEIRTFPERGVGVIAIDGGRHDITPSGAEDFPLPGSERLLAGTYSGDVFVELGTGEVFPLAV